MHLLNSKSQEKHIEEMFQVWEAVLSQYPNIFLRDKESSRLKIMVDLSGDFSYVLVDIHVLEDVSEIVAVPKIGVTTIKEDNIRRLSQLCEKINSMLESGTFIVNQETGEIKFILTCSRSEEMTDYEAVKGCMDLTMKVCDQYVEGMRDVAYI